jgi:hypothetical protein
VLLSIDLILFMSFLKMILHGGYLLPGICIAIFVQLLPIFFCSRNMMESSSAVQGVFFRLCMCGAVKVSESSIHAVCQKFVLCTSCHIAVRTGSK